MSWISVPIQHLSGSLSLLQATTCTLNGDSRAICPPLSLLISRLFTMFCATLAESEERLLFGRGIDVSAIGTAWHHPGRCGRSVFRPWCFAKSGGDSWNIHNR